MDNESSQFFINYSALPIKIKIKIKLSTSTLFYIHSMNTIRCYI